MAGAGGSILLHFKRRDVELTPGAHDTTLEAPVSEKLRGVLQRYGEWEWASQHSPDGDEGVQSSHSRIPGGVNGQGSAPDSLQSGPRPSGSEGAGAVPQATEQGSGPRRPAALEEASQHWQRLNFLPQGQVVYLNPDFTPRKARLKNGHRLLVSAKKVTPGAAAFTAPATPAPSTPGAGALQTPPTALGPAVPAEHTPAAPLTLGSQPSPHDEQQANALCAEMEARLRLAPDSPEGTPQPPPRPSSPGVVYPREAPREINTGPFLPAAPASADPPAPGHAPAVAALSQTPAGTTPGQAQGSSRAGDRLEKRDPTMAETGRGSQSEPVSNELGGRGSLGEQGSPGAGDMLDLMDQALGFMHRGDQFFLAGNPLRAALQYSKGLLLLESAPQGEVSGKMRILFAETKRQLLVCRAEEYKSMTGRALTGNDNSLTNKILRFSARSGLRLIQLYPQERLGYLQCASAWGGLHRNDAALEVLFQGEEELGHQCFKEARDGLLAGTQGRGAEGSRAEVARRAEALERALREQAVWEALAEEDTQWLQHLAKDVVRARVLVQGLPLEEADPWWKTAALYRCPRGTALFKLIRGPVTGALPLPPLLYSDEDLVRIETDPALASQDSYLRMLARASLPRGLYGELEPTPTVQQGRSSKQGGSKKKGASSKPQQEANTSFVPAPLAGPGESSHQREQQARNLELARRCNLLGNRDAVAGRMLGAALWYTRGLLLAFPQAWATSCGALNRMQAEMGPPGTMALALALLHNRSMVYQAMMQLLSREGEDTVRTYKGFMMRLASKVLADATWCAYYGRGWWRGALCLAHALQFFSDTLPLMVLEGEAASGGPGAEQLREEAARLRRVQRNSGGGRSSSRPPQRGPQAELLSLCQPGRAEDSVLESDFLFFAALHPMLQSGLEALAEEARARGEL